HQAWTQVFLVAPRVLGGIDTYGIALIHPMRAGRSPQQIGRTGLSNHRWIVGGKLCLLLNQWGLIVGWACATANVAEADPSNLKVCQRGGWEERMPVETVLSMLTLVRHFKRSCTGAGPIFRRAWRSPWRPSMCWSSGVGSSPTRRASCRSRSRSLVCNILI